MTVPRWDVVSTVRATVVYMEPPLSDAERMARQRVQYVVDRMAAEIETRVRQELVDRINAYADIARAELTAAVLKRDAR
jgi:hypothetical protein